MKPPSGDGGNAEALAAAHPLDEGPSMKPPSGDGGNFSELPVSEVRNVFPQ